ncbi:MAG: NAD(P)/FAD-dependent oxidoreductase [Bacillota bacterium]
MRHVIVVGGGAAGLMAAGQAGQAGAKVTLLEKNERLGKKMVITGKGRCNVTNDCDVPTLVANMPGNGRFLYSAFTALDSQALQNFLEQQGVRLKVERGQRVFPASDRSFDVIDGFRRFLTSAGVQTQLRTQVEQLLLGPDRVRGVIANGEAVQADAVIIATGGASYPATGSTGDGYALAGQAGHTIVPPRPALVPLETVEDWPRQLQGLTLRNIRLTFRQGGATLGSEFGEMLFTHFGISGPLVLTLSRLVTHRQAPMPITASINLKPALDEQQLDRRLQRDLEKLSRKQLKNALDELLPQRLIPVVIEQAGLDPEKPAHQISRPERQQLAQTLTDLTLSIRGTRPLAEAIVTAGGVDTREVDPRTMESRLLPGLHFAGEVLDVDGYTGGFNLQAAFSTGYVAGRAAALNL